MNAALSFLAYKRYLLGADSALFSTEYTDPSQDVAAAPYSAFSAGDGDLGSPGGGGGSGSYQQANATDAFDGSAGYQRQDY